MKLREFIKELKNIERIEGGDLDVIMADNIPVVSPIFTDKYFGKNVVITDEE